MGFAKFMSSGVGRGVRIVAGLVLIFIGLFSVGGAGSYGRRARLAGSHRAGRPVQRVGQRR